MNANTEPVEGFVYDADIYCADCIGDDRGEPVYGETDSPSHCRECGIPIDCELTTHGVEYVITDAGCCSELWPVLFADYLK